MHSSSTDLIKNDLVDAIKHRGKEDSYIDRDEEREAFVGSVRCV